MTCHWVQQFGEDSGSNIETETHRTKLVSLSLDVKTKIFPEGRVDRNVQISIGQVDAGRPLARSELRSDAPVGFHPKMRAMNELIQCLQIYDRTESPGLLWNCEEMGIEAG